MIICFRDRLFQKIIAPSFLALFVAYAAACDKGNNSSTNAPHRNHRLDETVVSKVPTDSIRLRREYAAKVVQTYPSEQFGAFLITQAELVLGKHVTQAAQQEFRSNTALKDFSEKRIEFLSQIFTTPELALLNQICAIPEGRSLIEKLPAHNELWKTYLAPATLKALTGERSVGKHGSNTP